MSNRPYIENLTAALMEYAPAIEKQYSEMIRYAFGQMVKECGPTLKNIYNNWNWARTFTSLVRANVHRPSYTETSLPNMQYEWEIDEVRLEKNAKTYAENAVREWEKKIVNKLGELDSCEVPYLANGYFLINGIKNGQNINISQQMIIKRSNRGTLFNQWPSRIRLDGKPISEAAYKKHFGFK